MVKVKVRIKGTCRELDELKLRNLIQASVRLREYYKCQCASLRDRIEHLEKSPDKYTVSNKDVAQILRDWLEDAEQIDYLLQNDEKSMREIYELICENAEIYQRLRKKGTLPDCWGVKHG